MNQGIQGRWTARLSQDFNVVFESTRADPFLRVRLEGGIEQRSKCFRQITGTHHRRTDTPPASLEHLEPQRAVLDARREEQSRRRPLKVVQQGKGSSVWQRVLAEHEVKLRRADQMVRVPIRAGELAAAATFRNHSSRLEELLAVSPMRSTLIGFACISFAFRAKLEGISNFAVLSVPNKSIADRALEVPAHGRVS